MIKKPTCKDLQNRIEELEKEISRQRQTAESLQANERTLKESESRLKALSDASFEAIFFSDKGICIDQNKTAERIFGYSDEEAIGQPCTAWIALGRTRTR